MVLEGLLDIELPEDLVDLIWFSIAVRGGGGGGGASVAAFEARLVDVVGFRTSVFSTVCVLCGRGEVKIFCLNIDQVEVISYLSSSDKKTHTIQVDLILIRFCTCSLISTRFRDFAEEALVGASSRVAKKGQVGVRR